MCSVGSEQGQAKHLEGDCPLGSRQKNKKSPGRWGLRCSLLTLPRKICPAGEKEKRPHCSFVTCGWVEQAEEKEVFEFVVFLGYVRLKGVHAV